MRWVVGCVAVALSVLLWIKHTPRTADPHTHNARPPYE